MNNYLKACENEEAVKREQLEGVELPVPFPEFYYGLIYTALEMLFHKEYDCYLPEPWPEEEYSSFVEAVFEKNGFVDMIRTRYNTPPMQLRLARMINTCLNYKNKEIVMEKAARFIEELKQVKGLEAVLFRPHIFEYEYDK